MKELTISFAFILRLGSIEIVPEDTSNLLLSGNLHELMIKEIEILLLGLQTFHAFELKGVYSVKSRRCYND